MNMSTVGMIIRKDFQQQRKRLLISAAVLILIAGMQLIDGGTLGVISGIYSGFAMVTAMGALYEEEQGGLLFLRTLPMSTGSVVLGKYLSALAFLLFYAVVIMMPVSLTKQISDIDVIMSIVAAFCVALLLIGPTLAVYFRYGYRAIQNMFVGTVLFIVLSQFIVYLLAELTKISSGPPPWLIHIIEQLKWLDNVDPVLVSGIFSLAALMFYASMGCLAVRGLRKRDL